MMGVLPSPEMGWEDFHLALDLDWTVEFQGFEDLEHYVACFYSAENDAFDDITTQWGVQV